MGWRLVAARNSSQEAAPGLGRSVANTIRQYAPCAAVFPISRLWRLHAPSRIYRQGGPGKEALNCKANRDDGVRPEAREQKNCKNEEVCGRHGEDGYARGSAPLWRSPTEATYPLGTADRLPARQALTKVKTGNGHSTTLIQCRIQYRVRAVIVPPWKNLHTFRNIIGPPSLSNPATVRSKSGH
jgi:hypothetical protein